MKKIICALILTFSYSCFSQKSEQRFIFEKDTLNYIRFDYSKYGLAYVHISVYEDNKENKMTPVYAESCLKRKENIYHTLYFFLELPKGKSQEEKEVIFSNFLKHITIKEDMLKDYIFLNFDNDYSKKYQTEIGSDGRSNVIKQILTQTTAEIICRRLNFKIK